MVQPSLEDMNDIEASPLLPTLLSTRLTWEPTCLREIRTPLEATVSQSMAFGASKVLVDGRSDPRDFKRKTHKRQGSDDLI